MNPPANSLYSVEAVANYILESAKGRGIGVTHLKMQKLVYFAQGFSLARLKRPLFGEAINAWTYGPVVPALYEKLRKYGSAVISGQLAAPDVVEKESREALVIEEMMDKLAQFSAMDLVRISHNERGPWYAAWYQQRHSRIPLWAIMAYFNDLLSPVAQPCSDAKAP